MKGGMTDIAKWASYVFTTKAVVKLHNVTHTRASGDILVSRVFDFELL